MTAKRIAIQSRLIGRGKVIMCIIEIMLLFMVVVACLTILVMSGKVLIDMVQYPDFYENSEIVETVIFFTIAGVVLGAVITLIVQGLING